MFTKNLVDLQLWVNLAFFIKGLCHAFKYQANLCKLEGNGSLIGNVVKEIKVSTNLNLNTWWGQIERIKQNLGIQFSLFSKIDVKGEYTRLPGAVPRPIGLFLFCIEFGWG